MPCAIEILGKPYDLVVFARDNCSQLVTRPALFFERRFRGGARSRKLLPCAIEFLTESRYLIILARYNRRLRDAIPAGGRIGDINKYADATGGPVLKTSKKEITARLSELLDQLRERYTLGYKPSTEKAAGSFCKLEVSLTSLSYQHSNSRKRDTLVRSRHGYYR